MDLVEDHNGLGTVLIKECGIAYHLLNRR